MAAGARGRVSSSTYILGTLVPCVLIVLSLTAFTVLGVRFLYVPTDLQRDAPQFINTSILKIRQVACALPRSGQYCVYQRYIYYGLLVASIATPIVFKEERGLWLASAAAGIAMLYSSLAGVHQMLIFGFGLRTQKRAQCESLPIPGTTQMLPVCPGFDDQDRDTACMVVGAALLAGLPMAVWSKVFKKAAARPILILWMLLMASSHVFCAVSKTEINVHYETCPAGSRENLPGLDYAAGALDATWRSRYLNLASNSSSTPTSPISSSNCIYSCFTPQGYPLMAGRTIAVLDNTKSALYQTPSLSSRRLGVAFWAIYLVFSLIALLELYAGSTDHDSSHFRPSHHFLRHLHRRHPWLTEKIDTRPLWHKFRAHHAKKVACLRLLVHTISHFPRFLSVVMFTGYVVFLEWTHRDAPESESFAAVGQFGAVVMVLLVACGALFSRMTQRDRRGVGRGESRWDEGDVELRGG